MARRQSDPKAAELARSRTLNAHPDAVRDEGFVSSEFFDARDLVQVKYEMVRKVETGDASVRGAADAFGAHKLTDEVLDYAQTLLAADPALGSTALADAVGQHFAIAVHPRSVERALARREAARSPKSP